MSNNAVNSTADIDSQILDQENQERQALAALLKKYLHQKNRILVQKTEMGGTEAYVGSVTLEWFAGQVRFASSLPLLQKKYNPQTDNIEVDADSIDEIRQRPLDWSRQLPLTQYLATRKNHKFPQFW